MMYIDKKRGIPPTCKYGDDFRYDFMDLRRHLNGYPYRYAVYTVDVMN